MQLTSPNDAATILSVEIDSREVQRLLRIDRAKLEHLCQVRLLRPRLASTRARRFRLLDVVALKGQLPTGSFSSSK